MGSNSTLAPWLRMVCTSSTSSISSMKSLNSVSLINARFVKPFDEMLIHKCSKEHTLLVTMEENVQTGGFGEGVCAFVNETQLDISVLNISLPDDYIEHGSVSILQAEAGIDADSVYERIVSFYGNM